MSEGFNTGELFKESPERDSELELADRAERLLQRLDFQVIEDIFGEERERSGVKRTIPAFEINHRSSNRNLGAWHIEKRRISLNLKELYRTASREKEGESQVADDSFEGWITSVLTHELAHAHGHNWCKDKSMGEMLRSAFQNMFGIIPEYFTEVISQTGYAQYIKNEGVTHSAYVDFNEAVTDMVAEEVYNEYKRRTADELMKEVNYKPGYPRAINHLAIFITLVCKRTEASPENVWRAIKHGYFSGLNLNDTELGLIFQDLHDAFLLDDGISERRYFARRDVEMILSHRLDSEDFLERIQQALGELTKGAQQDY